MTDLSKKGRHYLRKTCPAKDCGQPAIYEYRPYCSFSCQFLDPSQPAQSGGSFRGNKERGMNRRKMEDR